MRWIFPSLTWAQFRLMFVFGVAGALVAGIYGVVHDLITVRLGEEYFTRFKSLQFYYLDASTSLDVLAAKIGFMATWWVGFLAAWFMARITLPYEPVTKAARRILVAIGGMIVAALVSALWAGWTSPHQMDDPSLAVWEIFFYDFQIDDKLGFVKAARIHNASYLGALIGLTAALLWLRLTRPAQLK